MSGNRISVTVNLGGTSYIGELEAKYSSSSPIPLRYIVTLLIMEWWKFFIGLGFCLFAFLLYIPAFQKVDTDLIKWWAIGLGAVISLALAILPSELEKEIDLFPRIIHIIQMATQLFSMFAIAVYSTAYTAFGADFVEPNQHLWFYLTFLCGCICNVCLFTTLDSKAGKIATILFCTICVTLVSLACCFHPLFRSHPASNYALENIEINATKKENTSFYISATFSFEFEISNDNPVDLRYLNGVLTITNTNNELLASCDTQLAVETSNGKQMGFCMIYVDAGKESTELWSTNLRNLNLLFSPENAEFEDGTLFTYKTENVLTLNSFSNANG